MCLELFWWRWNSSERRVSSFLSFISSVAGCCWCFDAGQALCLWSGPMPTYCYFLSNPNTGIVSLPVKRWSTILSVRPSLSPLLISQKNISTSQIKLSTIIYCTCSILALLYWQISTVWQTRLELTFSLGTKRIALNSWTPP